MGALLSAILGYEREIGTRRQPAYTADGLLDFSRMTEVFKDESIVSLYSLTLKSIGVCELDITSSMIKWGGAHVFAKHVHFSKRGRRLQFEVYCPDFGDDSFSGVGVFESFDLIKDSNGGFRGTFRRDGEPSQQVILTRKERTPESIAASMPTVVRKDTLECCPVCLEEFDGKDVIKVVTSCNHAFCLGCILEICGLSPPQTEGNCPMCRGVVKTEEVSELIAALALSTMQPIHSSFLRHTHTDTRAHTKQIVAANAATFGCRRRLRP